MPCQTQTLSLIYPKVRDSHLNRWIALPTKITLNTTPRCVPHILIGNMWSTKLQCLRPKIRQTCGKPQTQSRSNCQCMHNSSQHCETDHLGFRAHETHRHVMQQKWKLMQNSWQLTENRSNWVPQVQVPSSSKSSKILKFQDIPKLPFHSNLSLTALSPQLLHFYSQLLSASKSSTTTRPGTITKKPIHREDIPLCSNDLVSLRGKLV